MFISAVNTRRSADLQNLQLITQIDWLIGITDTTNKTCFTPCRSSSRRLLPLENVAILYALRTRMEILQNHYDRMRANPSDLGAAGLELRLLLFGTAAIV